VAGALGQIGEFSFNLATVGTALQALPAEAMHTLVAASIFTVAVNPPVYRTVAPPEARLAQGPARWTGRTEAAPLARRPRHPLHRDRTDRRDHRR
jgi:monovalent cation:H+ antiporter-2, CPA2 family